MSKQQNNITTSITNGVERHSCSPLPYPNRHIEHGYEMQRRDDGNGWILRRTDEESNRLTYPLRNRLSMDDMDMLRLIAIMDIHHMAGSRVTRLVQRELRSREG